MNSEDSKLDYFGLRILLGFVLAVLVVTAYTAGVKFELLILALFVGSVTLLIQLRELSWPWRVGIIAILGLKVYSFHQFGLKENFSVSHQTVIIDNEYAIKYGWVNPFALAVCITSFWVSMLSVFKLLQKPRGSN